MTDDMILFVNSAVQYKQRCSKTVAAQNFLKNPGGLEPHSYGESWIHPCKRCSKSIIMTKSKNVTVTRSITCLATNTLSVVVVTGSSTVVIYSPIQNHKLL